MKKWLIISFLIVCKFTFAQNKIGIADTLFLLEELPSRDSTIEMIKAKKAGYAGELKKMDSILVEKKAYYTANKSSWTSLVVKNQENQIAALQNKIREFKTQTDEEIQRLNKECDERSLKIMHEAMEKVSSDLQLKTVWDKSQALSSNDEIDITKEVFTEMVKIDQTAE